MARMRAAPSSRATLTRRAPMSRQNAAVAELEVLTWVETWIGMCGTRFMAMLMMPGSAMMSPSTSMPASSSR